MARGLLNAGGGEAAEAGACTNALYHGTEADRLVLQVTGFELTLTDVYHVRVVLIRARSRC